MGPLILLAVFTLSILGWAISTIAAGGAAILLIAIVPFFIPISQLIPALSIGATIGNVHRLFIFKQNVRWDILKFIIPGVLAGSFLGAYFFSKLKFKELIWIVIVFLTYHLVRKYFFKNKLSFKMKKYYFLPASFINALISSMAGASGPVMNPFYLNSKIKKESIIATKTFASLFMQVSKILAYFSFLDINKEIINIGIAIGIGSIFGNILGKKVLKGLSKEHFSRAVDLFILFSVASLVYKNI